MIYHRRQIQMKSEIVYEKVVTQQDVLNEAAKIWKKVQRYRVKPAKIYNLFADKLYYVVARQYPSFMKSYPIIVRFMCHFADFNTRAMKRWLTKVSTTTCKNEDEYLDLQADYVHHLYSAKKGHYSQAQLRALHDNIRAALGEESKSFKSALKKAEAAVVGLEQALSLKNRQELRDFIQKVGAEGMEMAGTVRVEAEDMPQCVDQGQSLSESDVCPAEGLPSGGEASSAIAALCFGEN
jgi:hypothetical protein